jgi:aryl-alcohol dehydrogenase-like predicted oxidoreductase
MREPRRTLAPDSIRRECEASLRRLGIERIDLYQFHWPDESGTRIEDSWAAMLKLVQEGKVHATGVSNFDVPLLSRCEAIGHVDSRQPPFSLINRAAVAWIPWCASHRHRRDLLQPDAVRLADQQLHGRPRGVAGRR